MSNRGLSREQTIQLVKIAAQPDYEIDVSDIPETSEENWAFARRGILYRPLKLPVCMLQNRKDAEPE